MSLNSQDPGIEWTAVFGKRTGKTWNVMGGCFHNCEWLNPDGSLAICYAEVIANKFSKAFPSGFKHHYFHPDRLEEPLRLKQRAGIFIDSMSDMFGNEVPSHEIAQVLDICRRAHWHVMMSLTKNSPRLLKFADLFPANLWVGASIPPSSFKGKFLSIEQQSRMFATSLKVLGKLPVPVRWMSLEPLSFDCSDLLHGCGLSWVVIGAATHGKKVWQPDPRHIENVLRVLDEQNIPVFMKGNLHCLRCGAQEGALLKSGKVRLIVAYADVRGDWLPDNLGTLCGSCYQTWHNENEKRLAYGSRAAPTSLVRLAKEYA